VEISSGANWVLQAGKGFKYKDSAAASNGVKSMLLRAGDPGKAKISFSASGMAIPMPTPFAPGQYFEQDPNVVVQLINDLGFCWTSTFATPGLKNIGTAFKDRSP
jgi:hypothetical protein